ncbi:HAMP domain-containing histidine kinase [Ancylothrix sp. C2]|uniref:sensor histidine kinase n=1 Tax=Ancylothrix sp. D3o TaxID=2953691 RepID=UPI0021BBA8C9|nr:HAMP domain-containing sensor histidine kinase [Ancylothrix sp. D3o]MCT7948640.1 HAMP domain-containing histidine kinase [Ancylothrix sp. D3o]
MNLTVFKNSSATGGDLMRGSDAEPKWFLPTLADVFALTQPESGLHTPAFGETISTDRLGSKNRNDILFRSAVVALESLLIEMRGRLSGDEASQALILSGPVPVLSHPDIISSLNIWAFSGDPLNPSVWLLEKPVGSGSGTSMPARNIFDTPAPTLPMLSESNQKTASKPLSSQVVPLLLDDPLSNEQFCVCLTEKFSLVFTAKQGTNFQFSFDPEVVSETLRVLRPRVLLTGGQEQLKVLDAAVAKVRPTVPDYKIVMRFSQIILNNIPERQETAPNRKKCVHLLPASVQESELIEPALNNLEEKLADNLKFELKPKKHLSKEVIERLAAGNEKQLKQEKPAADLELLQAIFHEVRTPLTTIRTLTRLLLKRQSLDADVIKRLQMIDRECTEQIDRFNLIFKAVEIETSQTKRTPVQLTSTSLAEVFNSCIPRWQKQAARRNLTLDIILPRTLPPVVSDPTMLDQVLTGAIENFTATQPTSAHIRVLVTLAGAQLKLQLQSELAENEPTTTNSPLKSLGQLLMFQPETGNLSLNLDVTKNLFQALGGKLIVRQKPQQGDTLTIFLPIE